jgi:hypothetical protein
MKPCKIVGCDHEVKNESRTGICQQCRSSLYYWSKKRPAQVLIRRGKLHKYTNRLKEFFDEKGHQQKAKPAKPRKPRAEGRPANTTLN